MLNMHNFYRHLFSASEANWYMQLLSWLTQMTPDQVALLDTATGWGDWWAGKNKLTHQP